MTTDVEDVRVSVCCGKPESQIRRGFCSGCGEGTDFQVPPDPMADYTEAKDEVNRNYKIMDKSIAQAVMDELGYSIPALFAWTDSVSGDKWRISIDARAELIERGKPREEPA